MEGVHVLHRGCMEQPVGTGQSEAVLVVRDQVDEHLVAREGRQEAGELLRVVQLIVDAADERDLDEQRPHLVGGALRLVRVRGRGRGRGRVRLTLALTLTLTLTSAERKVSRSSTILCRVVGTSRRRSGSSAACTWLTIGLGLGLGLKG